MHRSTVLNLNNREDCGFIDYLRPPEMKALLMPGLMLPGKTNEKGGQKQHISIPGHASVEVLGRR